STESVFDNPYVLGASELPLAVVWPVFSALLACAGLYWRLQLVRLPAPVLVSTLAWLVAQAMVKGFDLLLAHRLGIDPILYACAIQTALSIREQPAAIRRRLARFVFTWACAIYLFYSALVLLMDLWQ
ncbi:MAG: hypothetical protein HUU35_13420, partial [Armatimonadetes bacterium]|nr:hypothetical protein [Armatimonadota bacterium]